MVVGGTDNLDCRGVAILRLKLTDKKRQTLLLCAGLFCFLTAFVLLQSFKGRFGDEEWVLPELEETIAVGQQRAAPAEEAVLPLSAAMSDGAAQWIVYVTGAVKKPGVYEISPDSRVYQLLDLAGGFAGGADREGINLAAPLQDGMHISFPAKGEPREQLPLNVTPPAKPAAGKSSKVSININACSAVELMQLPGIGPKTAQMIMEHRDENGGFGRVEDLLLIKGIGPKKYDAIRELVVAAP